MTTTFKWVAARAAVLGLLVSGCPQVTVAVCGPETCAGCCDSANVCQLSCDPGGAADAGASDAGGSDAGEPDAGQPGGDPPDGGETDAGADDAGGPDAGTADAGAVDAGSAAPDGGSPTVRTITGTRMQTFVRDLGPLSVPSNLSGSVLMAHSDSDGGPFVSVAGSARPDGGFAIPGVAPGAYTLQFRSEVYVATRQDEVDLSVTFMGRPNTRGALTPTPLTVNASGLAPWNTNTYLGLTCTNLGLSVDDLRDVGGPTPAAGTTATSFTIDLSKGSQPWLIEAPEGDTLVFTQIQAMASPRPHLVAVRAATVTGLTQLAGQTSIVNASFAPLVPSPLALDWRVTQFEAFRADVHASATASAHQLLIYGSPAQALAWGNTQMLLYMHLAAGAADLTGTVQLGNPFGPGVAMHAHYGSAFSVPVQAPGAAATALSAQVVRAGPVSALSGPLLPVVSPPRSVTLNGAAPSAAGSVGTTPIVAWVPPALGTPDHYTVSVMRLTNVSGQTKVTQVGSILVKGTRVRIPPGLLAAGSTYALVVIANVASGVDIERTPFARSAMPTAFAEAVIPSLTP